MRRLKPDYKTLLFMRARQRDDGSEDPDFVLNQPQFREPGILVTGHNFGAGSSRESAVWAMLANNIRVIVARSFADIYRENCLQNGAAADRAARRRTRTRSTQRVMAVNGAGAVHGRSRNADASAVPAAPISPSTSRPPTACACSKASTTSGSRSSTPTRSRLGRSARRLRSRGCRAARDSRQR